MLTAEDVSFLPDEPLPAFEARWAAALADPADGGNPEVLAALMTRFGTGAFASQVAAILRRKPAAELCVAQEALLAYVVRYDADLARPLLRQAVAASGTKRCFGSVFGDVARYTTSDVLTEEAMEALEASDPAVAADAARYLMKFGEERAREPLLTRYRTWTTEWAGKAEELEPKNPMEMWTNWQQSALGQALAGALLGSEGWVPDEGLRAEVLERCVGKQMCSFVQGIVGQEHSPYMVNWYRAHGQLDVHIGPYEAPNLALLKKKLAQFPRTTVFERQQSLASSDDARDAAEVQKAFAEAGRELVPTP